MFYSFKKTSFLFLALLFSTSIIAQDDYWQQHVDYTINVKLNDVDNVINADMTLVYTNNSKVELNELYFHLWPNAYRDRSSALTQQLLEEGNTSLYFATEVERGYIDGISFKVGGANASHELDNKHIDIAKLILPEPLPPGEKVTITTPFMVKIPSSKFSRLGQKNESFQLTQWYPKPAVYDKKGWHAYPYLNQGEFFSEFGKFTVNITVPSKYIVAATGVLQNKDELEWLNLIANKSEKSTFIKKDNSEFKTLTYIQDNVHDFAWFASKDFNVGKEVFALPGTDREITAWTFFPDTERDLWKEATTYAKDGVIHYSRYVGEYPYDVVTAVHAPLSAGAGMEYPTITVIGNSGAANVLETVIVHEVGHNWFYGILGSNEREHAWMDEGVNTYYEATYYIKRDKYPNDNLNENLMSTVPIVSKLFDTDRLNYMELYKYLYTIVGSSGYSQQANMRGDNFGSANYGLVVYMKVGALLYELKNYLGEEAFNNCMKEYYSEYKFKHPYPEDMQKVFERTSGEDLDWFFKDVLNTKEDVDYKIKGIKKYDDRTIVKVKNNSNLSVPVSITQYHQDKIVNEEYAKGFVGDSILVIKLIDGADRIMIANKGAIDINEKDNHIRTKGIFKKWNKINFKFIGYPERSDRSTIFYTPAIDYNYYDKMSLGASFYNSFLQTKKFEYVITPMYGFGSNELIGRVYTNYNFIFKSSKIQSVVLDAELDYFNYSKNKLELEAGNPTTEYQKYLRVNPSVEVNFRKKKFRSSINESLVLENKSIHKNKFNYDVINGIYKEVDVWNHLYNLSYNYSNKRVLDPYEILFSSEFSEEHSKLSATFSQSFTYGKSPGEFSFRIFTGVFIFDDSELNDYRFRLSGWQGKNDYAFD
ncbi:MAG: M1 family metallopeptidase, partial [Bacteroidia bacterium]|nr:M1 family metallopeptidase [Bacteroidia bacterium]